MRPALSALGFDVSTAVYAGLGGMTNGDLMRRAAAAGFEILITTDAGIAHQHNSAALPLAIIILHPRSNQYADIQPMLPQLERTLRMPLNPGVIHVP